MSQAVMKDNISRIRGYEKQVGQTLTRRQARRIDKKYKKNFKKILGKEWGGK